MIQDYIIRIAFHPSEGGVVNRTYDIFQVSSESIAIESAKQIFFHEYGRHNGTLQAWVVMTVPAQIGIRVPKERR